MDFIAQFYMLKNPKIFYFKLKLQLTIWNDLIAVLEPSNVGPRVTHNPERRVINNSWGFLAVAHVKKKQYHNERIH